MLTQQTTDLARIRQLLEQGVNINSSPNNNSSSTQPSEAAVSPNAGFERVLAAHAKPDYAQGDDLVDTFMSVPQKLTPLVSGDLPSYILQSYVQDTLCGRDPNTMEWNPQPRHQLENLPRSTHHRLHPPQGRHLLRWLSSGRRRRRLYLHSRRRSQNRRPSH